MIIALFVLLVLPCLSYAASFDCAKAVSLTEMTICNDPELSRLDEELSGIYQGAKAKTADQEAFRRQTQAAWKWRETNCRSKECLINWYAQRKATLLTIADLPIDAKCLKAGPLR